jgi:hypothetical protein
VFDTPGAALIAVLIADLGGLCAALATPGLDSSSEDELLDVLRMVEVARRQLAAFDQALLAELDHRGTAQARGCATLSALLRAALRVTPGEASARVKAAHAAGPRRAMDGSPLAPLHPLVAVAQSDGVLSAAHARVIADAINALPAVLHAEHAEPLETALVAHAREYDPVTLARLARYHLDHLDPDGTVTDEADLARLRELTLTIRPNGAGRLRGELDQECAELLATVLDSLARPRNVDGDPDTRTAGMRRHDAVTDALRMLIRSEQIPDAGGTPTTVILTAAAEDWQSGSGLVRTAHGASVTVSQAKKIAGAEATYVPVILNAAKRIIAYGTGHRIVGKTQRYALIARDLGCTWPGCDAPPQRCEAHHMTNWSRTHRTSVDDTALLCPRDHANLDHNGWTSTMIDGRPYYIPPPWIDPEQTPRRNQLHDPDWREPPPATTPTPTPTGVPNSSGPQPNGLDRVGLVGAAGVSERSSGDATVSGGPSHRLLGEVAGRSRSGERRPGIAETRDG